ncbi:MAG TPA: xanthine dehydrogenase family protein subunit M [Vicinamibacterales bacterium]
MAIVHDVMPVFELFQPTTVEDTLALLDQYDKDAWVLAGGLDTFDWFKDRNKRRRVVVDLSGVPALRGVKKAADGGLEIGAATTLTDLANDAGVKDSFKLLSQAAGLVASPQIRNQGTLGGNISQDTRCWYYRSGWTCYRAGGNICYADTPTAINREHAIFEANRCVAVNPSDTAPALVALDARMVIRSMDGEREVNAEDYFIGPSTDIMRMTVLRPGELLTAIRVPATWANAEFYFEKVRERQVWDFPLVNVASALKVSGGTIQSSRIVINAVAARPMRMRPVEDAIAGKPRNEATAAMAGDLAVQGARPLAHNGYKIPLVRNLVKRAIRGGALA